MKVVILGAGPAGCAAALVLLRAGVQVRLVESTAFPRYRPGETLHPGVESLVNSLGIASVLDCSEVRHNGIWVNWGGSNAFVPFGADADGTWLGYQISRQKLDSALIDAALSQGATLTLGHVLDVKRTPAGVLRGIVSNCGEIEANSVFDCTGNNAWLLRRIGVPLQQKSPTLFANFGYAKGNSLLSLPSIGADAHGWTWLAKVAHSRYHWTRVTLGANRPPKNWVPSAFADLKLERTQGANVSWRIARRCAGPGWFACGDAAARLDPSSSHGVLHALMTGMMAAHLAIQEPPNAARLYDAWVAEWFDHDSTMMARNYRQARLFGYAN